MINRDKYRVEHPVQPMVPFLLYEMTDANWVDFNNRVERFRHEKQTYEIESKEWGIKQNELNAKYKVDLLNDLGLGGHEKAEGIWKLAEEIAGAIYNDESDVKYDEIFNYYIEELAKLVILKN